MWPFGAAASIVLNPDHGAVSGSPTGLSKQRLGRGEGSLMRWRAADLRGKWSTVSVYSPQSAVCGGCVVVVTMSPHRRIAGRAVACAGSEVAV